LAIVESMNAAVAKPAMAFVLIRRLLTAPTQVRFLRPQLCALGRAAKVPGIQPGEAGSIPAGHSWGSANGRLPGFEPGDAGSSPAPRTLVIDAGSSSGSPTSVTSLKSRLPPPIDQDHYYRTAVALSSSTSIELTKDEKEDENENDTNAPQLSPPAALDYDARHSQSPSTPSPRSAP
jgi:hypothetical protein